MLDASQLPQFAVLPVSIEPQAISLAYAKLEYAGDPTQPYLSPPPKEFFGLKDGAMVNMGDPTFPNPPPPPK